MVLRTVLDGSLAMVAALGALLGASALVLAAAPPREDAVVLVVAPPWGVGAQQIVQHAGGQLVGPQSAVFGVLAQFDGPPPVDALRRLGAWAVQDGALIARLCGGVVE